MSIGMATAVGRIHNPLCHPSSAESGDVAVLGSEGAVEQDAEHHEPVLSPE